MIEDDLRGMLRERTGDLPVNGRRVAEVRHRITVTRRRRTAGAALALVLIALAGALLTRLPGHPETLPAGVPPGPWFDAGDQPSVPGWTPARFGGPLKFRGPTPRPVPAEIIPAVSYLVVARCEQRGTLNLGGRGLVRCTIPVGDRFEGALMLTNEQGRTLFTDPEPTWVPGSGGLWEVEVLEESAVDTLIPGSTELPALVEGTVDPTGGTFPLTVPTGRPAGVAVHVQCARDVVLRFSLGTELLVTADCGSGNLEVMQGGTSVVASLDDFRRVGVQPGESIEVTVRSVGRATDQWRVVSAE